MIAPKNKPPAREADPAARDASGPGSKRPRIATWLLPGLLCLLLALSTFAIYLGVAGNDFINYDDQDYVAENMHVRSGLGWKNVEWAFKTGHSSNWHPLTWISHMADCQMFGMQPGRMHLVSVGFHAANVVLLFLVLRGMTGAVWRSLMVAALFALHPLHVESVAWVSERKDVLSAFFFLLTIGAYARYARDRSRAENPGQAASPAGSSPVPVTQWSVFYLLSVLFFLLGLLSKPMLVTTPFVLLLIDYWPMRRFGIPGAGSQSGAVLRVLREKIPFFALSAVSSIITFQAQKKGGAVSTVLSMGDRAANALVSYARYIRKMFWPDDLAVFYPHPGHWPWWAVVVCAAFLLVISAVVLISGRRRPYLMMGWLWFIGMLIPVIGLVQVGLQSMADRYAYLPSIGLLIMVVWGASDLLAQRLPPAWRSGALAAGGAAALVACENLTGRQIEFWRNSQTLFQHTIEVTPDNYLAHNYLGFWFFGKGRLAEALEQYHLALKINPGYEDALDNLGNALASQGKLDEAIPLYEAALRTRPNQAELHNNFGNALARIGKIDEAIPHYLVALAQNPEYADAHNNLGIALAMQGEEDEAISHFHDAIRYKPDYASAHSNLGNALSARHRLDEAITEFRESLRLKPDDARAHNNLGNALFKQGRMEEAVGHYREALRLSPDNNPEAHYNLGLSLARLGRRDDARGHFAEALRLKPDYTDAAHQIELLENPSR